MEVKIGIQSIPRELVLETRASPEEIERSLAKALADGGLFVLPDDKDGKIIVPAEPGPASACTLTGPGVGLRANRPRVGL